MSEIFFQYVPLVWLLLNIFVIKERPIKKFLVRWLVIVLICFEIGMILVYQNGHMMGGRWSWCEGFYYGWFLVGLITVIQIFKKGLLWSLNKLVPLSKSLIRIVYVRILYYAVLFVFIVPFFLAMTSVHRCKASNALNPREALGLEYEDVSWKTSDGLNIKGWFIPASSDNAVLIAHGLGANKSNFIGTAAFWHHLGFNVLIFDFRGHGDSDGHTVSFGYRERLDIVGGWKYLTQIKKFRADKIVGYGVSFGGAAMIHADNQIHGFHQLIIDSSFASLDTMAQHIIDEEPIVPYFFRQPFKEIALFFVRLDLGFDIREKSPENVVSNLTGTPILFIHGKGDPLIQWTQSERLFDRAGEPKQIIILNTQGHFGTFNDPNYQKIITSFLESGEKNKIISL